MDNYETKEPEYIEESEEILLLRKYYTPEILNIQQGHLSLAFTLLINTLFIMYNHTKFSHLVERSNIHEESKMFSMTMKNIVEVNDWSRSTASIAFNSLKKLLLKTNISKNFISTITLPYDKKIKQNSPEFCLPTKYKKLPDNNPEKIIILNFIKKTKKNSKYKSQSSIRMFISFVLNFLQYHNISITQYQNVSDLSFENITDSLNYIFPNKQKRIKIHYTMVFICFVLGDANKLKDFEIYKKTIIPIKKTILDTDVHRISKEELEKMYEASQDNLKYQTIFLLMISTGIRTVGVSNVKLENICTIVNDNITINKTGRTIEKGNKWFTFVISEKLSELLLKYITTQRKNISSYLFPGRGEDIGLSPSSISAIIKKISKKAGLSGKHIHAHSLRHSFAHILLETGNKPELVSKMLGHSSTITTEHYYLKESASEASKRMNIPWIERTEQENPVPSFLNNQNKDRKVEKKKSKSERNKILRNLAKDFKSSGKLVIIQE